MKEIAASEFKANCLAIIGRVNKTRKPVRITRYGKPLAEIVPPAVKKPRGKFIGVMAGTMEIVGDIVSPAFDESEFDALRD